MSESNEQYRVTHGDAAFVMNKADADRYIAANPGAKKEAATYVNAGQRLAAAEAEAPTPAESPPATKTLEDHTIEELKALAEERGVEVPNGPKADIVAALEGAVKDPQE